MLVLQNLISVIFISRYIQFIYIFN